MFPGWNTILSRAGATSIRVKSIKRYPTWFFRGLTYVGRQYFVMRCVVVFVGLGRWQQHRSFDVGFELLHLRWGYQYLPLVLIRIDSADRHLQVVNLFEKYAFRFDIVFHQFNHLWSPLKLVFNFLAVHYKIVLPYDFTWVMEEIRFLMEFI